MIPLFSIVLLGIALVSAAEFYVVIVILNVILLTIAVVDGHDFTVWFVIYELSIITGISALTLESRSYRRLYAFLVMFSSTLLASAAFYVCINFSRDSLLQAWFPIVFATVVIFVKIPAFPFSIWLPEAHVEASWPGSIVLAGFALKFSVIAALTFVTEIMLKIDFLIAILVFSFVFAAFCMATTADAKKLIANFSIVHMSATILVLSAPANSEYVLNFSWHHHSIVTSWIFMLIGFAYALSASRLFRFLVCDRASLVHFILVLFALFTITLDLPWTSNIFVELSFVCILRSFLPLVILLVFHFWVVVMAFLIISYSKSSRVSGIVDISSQMAHLLGISTVILILIGFAIVRKINTYIVDMNIFWLSFVFVAWASGCSVGICVF